MKREEFIEKKADFHYFVREKILLERKNILREVVSYDFATKLTAKEKSEIKSDFESSPFIEKIEFNGTVATANFTLNIGYKDVANFVRNLPQFSETLLPSSYVFDEDASVKWNREKVAEENEAIKKRKLLDIEARKLLAKTEKQAIIYEVRFFYGIDAVKYESVENLYDYLDGIFAGDTDRVAKEIFNLVNTVIAFCDAENLKIKRKNPFN